VKLIFVNRYFHPDHSATAQLLSDVAFHLVDRGGEVHVITSRARYDDPDAGLPRKDNIGGVEIHRVSTTSFGRTRLRGRLVDYLSFHLSATLALRRLASSGDIVVVKTDPPLFAVTALHLLKRRRAMLVNWLQDIFPEVAAKSGLISTSSLIYRVSRALRDRALARAAVNVAICEAMKRHLEGLGLSRDSIRVIPNWADGEAIHPISAHHNELRASWGLRDQFVVGYSGNLGRVHEVETIGDAVRRLQDHSEIGFVFIGGGSGYEALHEQIGDGSCETVQFRPYQPRDFLHLSLPTPDVHLVSLAPQMEGLAFASKLYGVLAAGRPVIFIGAGDGEVAHILAAENCGLSIEAGDADGLAAAIVRLKEDPQLSASMGRRARELFERDYDREIATERWSQLLLHDIAQFQSLKD